jgi:hypothetical protein
LDLRWTTPLSQTGACGAQPQNGDLDIESGLILAPGDPERSVLLQRMLSTDHARMPPVGSAEIDAIGTASVDAWIRTLESCAE